jgi:hypothetical protein
VVGMETIIGRFLTTLNRMSVGTARLDAAQGLLIRRLCRDFACVLLLKSKPELVGFLLQGIRGCRPFGRHLGEDLPQRDENPDLDAMKVRQRQVETVRVLWIEF